MSPFATTRWSLILDARTGPESARRAMEEIYRAYRGPVLAYVRRSGRSDGDAEDLVQDFFARLLEKRWDVGADPARTTPGRRRSAAATSIASTSTRRWRPSPRRIRPSARSNVRGRSR